MTRNGSMSALEAACMRYADSKLTNAQIAEQLGCSRQYVSLIFKAHGVLDRPRRTIPERVCPVCGVTFRKPERWQQTCSRTCGGRINSQSSLAYQDEQYLVFLVDFSISETARQMGVSWPTAYRAAKRLRAGGLLPAGRTTR